MSVDLIAPGTLVMAMCVYMYVAWWVCLISDAKIILCSCNLLFIGKAQKQSGVFKLQMVFKRFSSVFESQCNHKL